VSIPLAVPENIIDTSGVAPRIEKMLPAGVRHRQLRASTLLLGIQLTLADDRPAHLTRVHQALTALPAGDQARPGVAEERKAGPHQLTCRQAGRTSGLMADALAKEHPGGTPSDDLAGVCDDLLEASIPAAHKDASSSLAADRAGVESWSRPPRHGSTGCAAPEAHWGHRNSNLPGPRGEMLSGLHLPAATMAREENGPAVPGPARPMTLCSCALDPVRALTAVLPRMPAAGIPPGGIPDDSGYACHDAGAWAVLLRAAGAQLTQDLHPLTADPRAPATAPSPPRGTCTARPRPGRCWNPGRCPPPPPRTKPPRTTSRPPGQPATSPARSPLITLTATTASSAPPSRGRSAARSAPDSMTPDRGRPEILTPPGHPPACRAQHAITVPPAAAAKTRQEHHCPSAAHQRSCARRTSSGQTFSTIKDPAATTIARGWCQLTGLTPPALWTACLPAVRNQRILSASGPPGAERPPGRHRAPAQNPQAPPPDPRQPRRRPAITAAACPRDTSGSASPHTPGTTTQVPRAQNQAGQAAPGPRRLTYNIILGPAVPARPAAGNVRPKREHGPW